MIWSTTMETPREIRKDVSTSTSRKWSETKDVTKIDARPPAVEPGPPAG